MKTLAGFILVIAIQIVIAAVFMVFFMAIGFQDLTAGFVSGIITTSAGFLLHDKITLRT